MLTSYPFINKYVYITKSQFLFISEMLKMKLSLTLVKLYEIVRENQLWAFR